TVLIATISFAGYIAVRVLGPTRGLLVSALAGSLASSTAVTVALARMAAGAGPVRPLVGAAALAALVSLLPVQVVIALLRPEVLPLVAPPALAAAFVMGGAGLAMLVRQREPLTPESTLRNPFELRTLLVFAAVFA